MIFVDFMMDSETREPAIVLTIAGSDSGGAAGLQADLKTLTQLGIYGMSVVTVVTAQNSQEISAAHPIPKDMVIAQLKSVLSDYGAAVIKTGFIGRADLILRDGKPDFLVVDPVLVNHKGASMFPSNVTRAYQKLLLPMADLVTPNKAEAMLLSGLSEDNDALHSLHALGCNWVLLKGKRIGGEIFDVLSDGRRLFEFRSPYLDTQNTHGSGDTLSAAICAFLAQGRTVPEAVESAHAFTHAAIKGAVKWQLGSGHGPLDLLH